MLNRTIAIVASGAGALRGGDTAIIALNMFVFRRLPRPVMSLAWAPASMPTMPITRLSLVAVVPLPLPMSPLLISLRRHCTCLCLCHSPLRRNTDHDPALRLGALLGMGTALTQTARVTCAVSMADSAFVPPPNIAGSPGNLVKTSSAYTLANSLEILLASNMSLQASIG